MPNPRVVSRADWLVARKDLLEEEKAFTRERDRLSKRRRELPWVLVDEDYRFEGKEGTRSLADLFDGKGQLVVYHFMFGPNDEEGCPLCSFWADNFERQAIHLAARDTRMIAISRAPLTKLLPFQRRLGWTFPWYSSADNRFNFDFGVSFPADQKEVDYNYRVGPTWGEEAPGISVFAKGDDGRVYHTYSCFSRGLDMMNAAYHYLDLTPKGRDEQDLDFSMAWVRYRDRY